MADDLQTQAEAVMAMLETRFGTAATYIKKGTPSEAANGALTPNDTSIACILVPRMLTQLDLVAVGADFLEQTLRGYKARKSVLGTGLSVGDQTTVGAVTYEVIAPVTLDPLEVTYHLVTREIA